MGGGDRGGAETDSFLEGPVFDARGNLYVTDFRTAGSFGSTRRSWELVAEFDGEPNGMNS